MISDLQDALRTRLVIGQAQGLLMERHRLDEDAAFKLLIKLSQRTHLKLRDIATRLVGDAATGSGLPKQAPGTPAQ
ncbi:MAG TPA: ANTAR domain-containing protein [Mycobacteriales bacterium]|nr:ANTAR domain-containing protein [Mycobacteriales bacterium]